VQRSLSWGAVYPALFFICGGSAFGVTCTPGMTIVGPGTLSTGATLSQSGPFCTEGPFTFSNFSVYGASVAAPIVNWTFNTGPATNAPGLVLDFAYFNLGVVGDTIQVTFSVAPGVSSVKLLAGPATNITESICSAPTGVGGTCPGTVLTQIGTLSASNGGSSSSAVTLAGTDYVFISTTNGASFAQTWMAAPPPPNTPAPSSLILGVLGLASVGVFFAFNRCRSRA
jgi:hypothetical protein